MHSHNIVPFYEIFPTQSLVATQQVIDQTSAIIKHQQKLLSASGDPPTPTTTLSSSPPPTSTKHTPHGRSHARQKLLFHSGVQQANGPSMVSQEMAGGAGNTPTHNPLQNSGPDVSPQMTQSMGMESTYVIRHMCIGLAYSIVRPSPSYLLGEVL